MKHLLSFLMAILISANLVAQAPNKMSYQCVIRNSSNILIVNTTVGIKISILQSSLSGTAVYVETHTTLTDDNGLASVDIGTGTPVTNTFASINWANGPYFVKTETDPLGGNNYSITGTGELLSVPYALFSANGAGSVGPAGANGKTILNGIIAPTTEGVEGDFYINTTTNELYGPKTASGWVSPPVSLVGPAGTTGATGQAGANGTNGLPGIAGAGYLATSITHHDLTVGPKIFATQTGLAYLPNDRVRLSYSSTQYVEGIVSTYNGADLAMSIDRVVGLGVNLFPWNIGIAGDVGAQGSTGLLGTNGKTILNGTIPPLVNMGVEGDFYINTNTKMLYGPKGVTSWTGTPVSLIGPAGSAGSTGSPGVNGTNGKSVLNGTVVPTTEGVEGDFYINTNTNQLYGPRGATSWSGTPVSLIGPAGLLSAGSVAGNTSYWNGSIWVLNSSNLFNNGGNIGIGTLTPSKILDVNDDALFNGITVGRGGGNILTNSSYGKDALNNNTSGNLNTANGFSVLKSNTTGTGNTANGSNTLANNTTGNYNTAIGFLSLPLNTTGYANTATGVQVLRTNITGSYNTASGLRALYDNYSGNYNTAAGAEALYSNFTGEFNTANGYRAFYYNKSGKSNTANGAYTLYLNTVGHFNTANGYHALFSNTLGSYNTAVGYYSDVSLGTLSNATSIGYNAISNANNKIRLGNSSVTVVEGQIAYSSPSDARFKRNVKDDVKGLDFILKLKPISYNFDRLAFAKHIHENTEGRESELENISKNRSVGFLAQDVEKLIEESGFTSFDAIHAPTNETDNYSLSYTHFVLPLVKAVQELSQQMDILKRENEKLKTENITLNESADERLKALEEKINSIISMSVSVKD